MHLSHIVFDCQWGEVAETAEGEQIVKVLRRQKTVVNFSALMIKHVGMLADILPEGVVLGREGVNAPNLTRRQETLSPAASPWANL
jgi:hypothetical protein